jgi:hypothetical protein
MRERDRAGQKGETRGGPAGGWGGRPPRDPAVSTRACASRAWLATEQGPRVPPGAICEDDSGAKKGFLSSSLDRPGGNTGLGLCVGCRAMEMVRRDFCLDSDEKSRGPTERQQNAPVNAVLPTEYDGCRSKPHGQSWQVLQSRRWNIGRGSAARTKVGLSVAWEPGIPSTNGRQ